MSDPRVAEWLRLIDETEQHMAHHRGVASDYEAEMKLAGANLELAIQYSDLQIAELQKGLGYARQRNQYKFELGCYLVDAGARDDGLLLLMSVYEDPDSSAEQRHTAHYKLRELGAI